MKTREGAGQRLARSSNRTPSQGLAERGIAGDTGLDRLFEITGERTGSKTTISGHLKAIEAKESSQLSDEALLSDHLKQMVGQLARDLQKEAQSRVEQVEQQHQAAMATLKEALGERTDELSQTQAQAAALAEERDQLRSHGTALQETVATQQSEGRAQQQRIADLEDQMRRLCHQHDATRPGLRERAACAGSCRRAC